MRRLILPERYKWREEAQEHGMLNIAPDDPDYWNEGHAYAFSLSEIENGIEDPATALHEMCLEAVDKVLRDEHLMRRFDIPEDYWGYIVGSWENDREHSLYGRMDFIYNGEGPAKLLEYNADTPTSLYESAAYQWIWMEGARDAGLIPEGSDQFNGIYDALVVQFRNMFKEGDVAHFTWLEGATEDEATCEYLAWAALEAGVTPHKTYLQKIGVTEEGYFTDSDSRIVRNMFKLYPWEDMFRDDFAKYLEGSHCRFLEPAWKQVLSNKAILPVLWEMFPDHPNLLESYFEEDLESGAKELAAESFVTKPIYSREGASVDIYVDGELATEASNREYDDHALIVQEYAPHPVFDEWHPLIGAWVVGKTCVGMGIRDSKTLITENSSSFTPHFIE